MVDRRRENARAAGARLLNTLIATAVVATCSGSLASIAWPRPASAVPRTDASEIHVLGSALDEWAIVHEGVYPADLERLVERGADGRNFLDLAHIRPDPWGNAFVYELRSPRGPWRLTSIGRDCVAGTADDLVVERRPVE